ncbi:MAG: right-handed parallel beta-helix repeat-containing protein [Planctomycetota bacterium]|jgi:parallel beta-helix repeat protein
MRSYLLWTVFIFAVSVGLQDSTFAVSYFVSSTGNDQAEGSEAQPWKTVARANQVLKPGDEVIVLGGKYQEGFLLSDLKGTKGHPLVIRAAQGQRVLIDLTAKSSSGIRIEDCVYVVIRNLEIAGATRGAGITLHNSHHCKIEGNVIHGCKGVGIRLSASSDNLVWGSICYHNDTGIYVGSGSTRNLIEGNVCAFGNRTSENADGIASSDCVENIYRFNVVSGI